MGQGRGQDFQVGTLGTQEHVYEVVPQTELAYQSYILGTFLLSHFLVRVFLNSNCIIFIFIVASCVKSLGLEVETLEELLHVSSPLGTRVRIDQISRDCEFEFAFAPIKTYGPISVNIIKMQRKEKNLALSPVAFPRSHSIFLLLPFLTLLFIFIFFILFFFIFLFFFTWRNVHLSFGVSAPKQFISFQFNLV